MYSRDIASWYRDLNHLVGGKLDVGSFLQEIFHFLRAAHELQQNRNGRCDECLVIHFESIVCKVGRDVEMDGEDVFGTHTWATRCSGIFEWYNATLEHWLAAWYEFRSWFFLWCPIVAENGRVDATFKSVGPDIRFRPDPVVVDWLVSVKNKRETLSHEDLNRIDRVWLDIM